MTWKRRKSYKKLSKDIDEMVEDLNERLENPFEEGYISNEERAAELVDEALEHIAEAAKLMRADGDDDAVEALEYWASKLEEMWEEDEPEDD